MPVSFHVGYEIGTGAPVSAELHHLAIFGLTQKAGKTTALEGFIERINGSTRVLIFRTGRGEIGFNKATKIPFFFRQRADWQFVEGLISAHLLEKARMYRGDIIKVVRGANTLEDVWSNIREALSNARSGSWPEKILVELNQYMSEIIPQMRQIHFSRELELLDRLSMMDLENLTPSMQQLIISSSINQVMKEHLGVIVVLPEGRDFIPGDRRTPAKLAVEDLIRKGAKLGNYLWLDSQALTGLDLNVMRNVGVWMFGRQDLDVEAERSSKMITSRGVSPYDIKSLKIGEFYLVQGQDVRKVYVQPAWMPPDQAKMVAVGEISKSEVERPILPEEERKVETVKEERSKEDLEIEKLEKKLRELRAKKVEKKETPEPVKIEVRVREYQLVVKEKKEKIFEYSTDNYYGQILFVLSGPLKGTGTREQIMDHAAEMGWRLVPVQTSAKLGMLVKEGLVIRDEGSGSPSFRLPEKVRITVEEA